MDTIVAPRTALNEQLQHSIFGDRGAQFVDRHQWNLSVTPEGLEIDEYDDAESHYLVVHDAGDHLISCRVRPVSAGTMVLEHFSGVFPEARGFLMAQAGRVWELTRFCRSPDLPTRETGPVISQLAEILDVFRDDNNITGFVAVVYPEVARFLSRNGARFLRIGTSELDGRRVDLICVTHAVCPKRLSREYGSELNARRAAFTPLQLAA